MDYQKIKLLKEKLIEDEIYFEENKEFIKFNNPVNKYNYFIRQYNKTFNKFEKIEMKHIGYLDKIYEIGYNIQIQPIKFIFLFILIPLFLFYIKRLIDVNKRYLYDFIFHIYMISIISLCLSILLILNYSKKILI
jgi:uncharacterized membrane protein YhaH (DUF805 family)